VVEVLDGVLTGPESIVVVLGVVVFLTGNNLNNYMTFCVSELFSNGNNTILLDTLRATMGITGLFLNDVYDYLVHTYQYVSVCLVELGQAKHFLLTLLVFIIVIVRTISLIILLESQLISLWRSKRKHLSKIIILGDTISEVSILCLQVTVIYDSNKQAPL